MGNTCSPTRNWPNPSLSWLRLYPTQLHSSSKGRYGTYVEQVGDRKQPGVMPTPGLPQQSHQLFLTASSPGTQERSL